MPITDGVYTLPWTFITRFVAGDIIPRSDFDSLMADVETGLNAALSSQALTSWDASAGAFPSDVQSGAAYYTTTAGTIDGTVFGVGDVIYALKDAPSTSTYTANWQRIPREALRQTRAQLKAWITAGNTPAVDTVYLAGDRYYIGSSGATSIPDMPGLLPLGDPWVEHMGAAGDGVTDDTNAFQYAINYLAAAGGKVKLRAVNYLVTVASLSVGAKQVLWDHEGATINGATTPDMPGIFAGFDPANGRWLYRVDRANQATSQPVWWVRQHNETGAAIGPIFRLVQFINSGSVVNGISPSTVIIDQQVAASSATLGSNDPTGLFVRTQAMPGIDAVDTYALDVAVNNCDQPSDGATMPADSIATRAGSMRALSLNSYRASAWNDEDDTAGDQAEVLPVLTRGGGEVYTALHMRSHSAHTHPWSGVAVGGTGSSGDKLTLPDEDTFSQTDDTWFTAQDHWVFFDQETGYDDPVTLYRISAFDASAREITLDTVLPEDAAGKRISIVGTYNTAVARNAIVLGQYSMSALAGVTIRNKSGNQLSEIVSTSSYAGPVLDYSGATLSSGRLISLPSDNTVDLGGSAVAFRNVFGSPVARSYTATNIADIGHALNTDGKFAGKVVFDTTNNRLMVAAGSGTSANWHVADGSASVTPS